MRYNNIIYGTQLPKNYVSFQTTAMFKKWVSNYTKGFPH